MNGMERWRARFEQAARVAAMRAPDTVGFRAPCPACGRECDWTAGRIGEGAVNEPLCPCPGVDVSGSSPAA